MVMAWVPQLRLRWTESGGCRRRWSINGAATQSA